MDNTYEEILDALIEINDKSSNKRSSSYLTNRALQLYEDPESRKEFIDVAKERVKRFRINCFSKSKIVTQSVIN